MNRKLGMAISLTATALFAWAQSGPPVRFDLKPGPYAVGLKVVQQYDYTRSFLPSVDALGKPFAGERARPLQTLVWYPSKKDHGKAMTWLDYLNLRAAETDFAHPHLDPAFKADWVDGTAPSHGVELASVRDAVPESGRFPVVIYAPSFSATSWENADLCEYLASHGFVVLACPDMGASSRAMTGDLDGVGAQAADIEFLVGYARSLPEADTSALAVGGFSWGGISNLFAAAHDDRIRALFAFDGSMRYAPGLVKQDGSVHPERMTVPLLYFKAGGSDMELMEMYTPVDQLSGPNVLNAWTHGDLVSVMMPGMSHQEFSSMYQRREALWQTTMKPPADYSREDGIRGYVWAARYTLAFLDAYLKHDPKAMEFLKKTPAENGVPPHILGVEFRAGRGPAPTMAGFRTQLGHQGFSHAAAIYAAMQGDGFELKENALNTYGYELLALGAVPEAIEILKLQVQLYPKSWNPYDSLGEAYAKAGKRDLAIQNYRKSLELNPGNDNARQVLKELGTEAPR